MGFIKQLKQFITGDKIFPITKTNAVYDDTVGRLDTFMQNMVVEAESLERGVMDVELRDADTLGGHLPEYFAKADDINELANMSGEMNEKLSKKLSFAEIVGIKKITANSTTTYILDKLPIVMYFYINKGNNALYTLPALTNTYGRAVADDIQINFTYNNNTKVLTVTCNVACDMIIYGLVR